MRKIALATAAVLVIVSILLGSIVTTSTAAATTNLTVPILVLKAKGYYETIDPEDRLWIKAKGWYARPCGYPGGREHFEMLVEDVSTYEHTITFTVTFLNEASLDLCTSYAEWSTEQPLGYFPKGVHVFNINGHGFTFNVTK